MERICSRYAKGTMSAGNQIYGKYAIIVLEGSLKNFLIGPGAESIAMTNILVSKRIPASFHKSAVIFGQLFFVR